MGILRELFLLNIYRVEKLKCSERLQYLIKNCIFLNDYVQNHVISNPRIYFKKDSNMIPHASNVCWNKNDWHSENY